MLPARQKWAGSEQQDHSERDCTSSHHRLHFSGKAGGMRENRRAVEFGHPEKDRAEALFSRLQCGPGGLANKDKLHVHKHRRRFGCRTLLHSGLDRRRDRFGAPDHDLDNNVPEEKAGRQDQARAAKQHEHELERPEAELEPNLRDGGRGVPRAEGDHRVPNLLDRIHGEGFDQLNSLRALVSPVVHKALAEEKQGMHGSMVVVPLLPRAGQAGNSAEPE